MPVPTPVVALICDGNLQSREAQRDHGTSASYRNGAAHAGKTVKMVFLLMHNLIGSVIGSVRTKKGGVTLAHSFFASRLQKLIFVRISFIGPLQQKRSHG